MPTVWWWTCTAPLPDRPHCLDAMERSTHKDDVLEDQRHHLDNAHPDWQPTQEQLALSHWHSPYELD